ncbi:MAG: cupin domain-containing protein [Bradyrhizobium sp.]|nr:cupin domain-containing protein [Bradyrhizobium sp.]
MSKSTSLICIAGVALALTSPVAAQQNLPVTTSQTQGIKRTPLQKIEVPGTDYEIVFGMAEFPPNMKIGRHTHPGAVLAYMIDGELILSIDGQGERAYKTGESLQVPGGAIHDERSGDKPAKVIAVYVVPKGTPLATPIK